MKLSRLSVAASMVLFGLFLVLDACKHKVPTPNEQDVVLPTVSENCDPDSVYFVNDILPILSSSCAYSGCHDAGSAQDGVVLDSYRNVMNTGDVRKGRPDNSDLYEVLLESGEKRMPPEPNAALSADDIEKIRKWIAQGANNNECTQCDTSNVTYTITVVDILNTNCITCHNNNSASGGVSLEGYNNVKTQVDNTQLKGVINHESGFKKMPPSGVKIPDCSINQINKWIEDGAPNN